MFKYVKFKIIRPAENPHWLFRNFVGKDIALDGRIVEFNNGTLGNHQIKHPRYSNWFDVPKDMVQVLNTYE